jgi:hypothetical protein
MRNKEKNKNKKNLQPPKVLVLLAKKQKKILKNGKNVSFMCYLDADNPSYE